MCGIYLSEHVTSNVTLSIDESMELYSLIWESSCSVPYVGMEEGIEDVIEAYIESYK